MKYLIFAFLFATNLISARAAQEKLPKTMSREEFLIYCTKQYPKIWGAKKAAQEGSAKSDCNDVLRTPPTGKNLIWSSGEPADSIPGPVSEGCLKPGISVGPCISRFIKEDEPQAQIITFCASIIDTSSSSDFRYGMPDPIYQKEIGSCYNRLASPNKTYDEALIDFCDSGNAKSDDKIKCASELANVKFSAFIKDNLLKCSNKAKEVNMGCVKLAATKAADDNTFERLNACESELTKLTNDPGFIKKLSGSLETKKVKNNISEQDHDSDHPSKSAE